MTLTAATGFPLARSSRARRRIAIQADYAAYATEPPSPPTDQSVEDAGARPVSVYLGAPADVLPWSPAQSILGADRLAGLLESAGPLTWLFAGDSLAGTARVQRGRPRVIDRFTGELRETPRRARDIVIDACFAACPLREVAQQLPARLPRLRPDVALVACGHADAAAGCAGLDAFEEHLTVVLRSIAAAGGIPVLSTPPALLLPDDAPQGIDQLVYVEAVRSLAAEFDVPLVDHWEHWEQCAVPPGRAGSWFDKDGQSPSAIGLAQIAERLLAELNLSGGRSRKSKEVATGARPERQSQR